jgi:hypothetical protein
MDRDADSRMKVLAEPHRNRLVYTKVLEGVECFQTWFTGFGTTVADHEIRIENRKGGAGVRITGDRPLSRFGYWSIRTVMGSSRTSISRLTQVRPSRGNGRTTIS